MAASLGSVEIRTFDGDSREVAKFTHSSWRASYGGTFPIPVWTEDYFDWQLLTPRPGGRDYLVAGYDGSRLVATLFGEPFRFQLNGHSFDGTTTSWLTVHPDYRRRGIAQQLVSEYRRRLLDLNAKFSLGFGIDEKTSAGTKFWTTYRETVLLGNVRWWARLLDHRGVAAWESSLFRQTSSRLLRVCQGTPVSSRLDVVRNYESRDLGACHKLIQKMTGPKELAYVWTEPRLAHQLKYRGVSETFVAEENGTPAGFVNYYRMDLEMKSILRAVIIDQLITRDLSHPVAKTLLSHCLAHMREQGIQVALTSRLSRASMPLLVESGFVPLPSKVAVICFCVPSDPEVSKVRQLYVHLR